MEKKNGFYEQKLGLIKMNKAMGLYQTGIYHDIPQDMAFGIFGIEKMQIHMGLRMGFK